MSLQLSGAVGRVKRWRCEGLRWGGGDGSRRRENLDRTQGNNCSVAVGALCEVAQNGMNDGRGWPGRHFRPPLRLSSPPQPRQRSGKSRPALEGLGQQREVGVSAVKRVKGMMVVYGIVQGGRSCVCVIM